MFDTILCKTIMPDNLDEFKAKISIYNFMSSVSDDTLKFIYNILLSKYGNSCLRYETQENFFNALSLRIYNTAPVFEKKLSIVKDALNLANENYFKSLKNATDIYDIDTTTGNTDVRKDAETPTAVKATTDFVDKYTNAMSKIISSGSGTDDRTITKSESTTADLIAKIDDLQKLYSLTIEEYSNTFNDLFIQFL